MSDGIGGSSTVNGQLEKGVFVLSIDAEIEPPVHDPGCQEMISFLLKLMEQYRIHATWVVQGILLTDRQAVAKQRTVIPDDQSLPSTEPSADGPDTASSGLPLWQGKNIIQQILSCQTSQEIGCHTFSHPRVGAPGYHREQFEVELKKCQREFNRYGVTPYSFVFPWNSVQYVDTLRDYGYIAYRGPSPDWYARLPPFLQRFAYPLDHWLFMPSPVAVISCETGVWNLPASYFYVCGQGWGRMIPISLRVDKVKRGLHLAVRKRRLFHLWFHPFNLIENTNIWLRGLENIFIEVNQYRDRGALDNLTMGELARNLKLQYGQKPV